MRSLSLIPVILLLGACNNAPSNSTHYYQFSSDSVVSNEFKNSLPTVHIDTIEFKGHIDQPALVQITEENQVHIAQYHFWSEHPKYTYQQSLLTHLNKLLPNSNVLLENKSKFKEGDTLLSISLSEIAGHFDKGAMLSGTWYLYELHKGEFELKQSKQFSYEEKLNDDGFSELVNAHQRNWSKAVQEISIKLKQ